MYLQNALENLTKVFLIFYISCAMVGRPDIPIKLIAKLRAESFAGVSTSWGCPSMTKKACEEYNPSFYKNK